MILGIFLGIVILGLTSIIIYIRYLPLKTLNFADWFVFSCGVLYGLIQSLVLFSVIDKTNTSVLIVSSSFTNGSSIILFLSVILTIYCTYWGYFSLKKLLNNKNWALLKFFDINISTLWHIRFSAWILFFSSVVIYFLYSRAYGGIHGLFAVAGEIRSNTITVENSLSFLEPLGGLSFFSSFLFLGILLERTKNNIIINIWDKLGLFLSFCFSLIILSSWLGRVGIATYILTFIISFSFISYINRGKIPLIRILLLFILGPVLVLISGWIMGRNFMDSPGNFFMQELIFPFISWNANQNNGGIRFFIDILLAPVFCLPQKIWQNWNIQTVDQFNTLVVTTFSQSGAIPVDFLTFSFLQGHILGVAICSFLWGGILYFLESAVNKITLVGLHAVLYVNVLLVVVMSNVLYADPLHLIKRSFYLLVGWIFLKLASKITKIKLIWIK